mgnify:CR=1 FL=1
MLSNFLTYVVWNLRKHTAADCMILSSLYLQNYQNMNINYDYKQCIGLKVKPRRGDALLFYSMFNNGTFDRVKSIKKSISIWHMCQKHYFSWKVSLYRHLYMVVARLWKAKSGLQQSGLEIKIDGELEE